MSTEQRWLNEHGSLVPATDGPLNLAAHAAAAEAAAVEVSGWWRRGAVEKFNVFCQHDDGIAPQLGRVMLRMNVHFPHEATAEHIARNPPAVTLALLRRIAELEAGYRRLMRGLLDQSRRDHIGHVDATAMRELLDRGVRLSDERRSR